MAIALTGWVLALAVALRPPNTYTEFYVLGSTGQLQSYPTRLEPGERFGLTFGVGNSEDEAQRYLLSAPFDGAWNVVTPLIASGELWEETLWLTAPDATGRTQLAFELYRFDTAEPYRTLHLFVTLPGPSVFPGMEELELRPRGPIAPDPAFIVHRLAPGETLFGLARTYLGNGNRFVEIVELNRELIGDVTDIPVGTPLRIPAAP